MSSVRSESDILIVGAGAKAAALAAKVHTINRLGLGEITMTVIEKTERAASWKGRNGMTSGEEPLAIPPIKDVGFPYQSARQFGEVGNEIDEALLPLSWQRYAMERGEYAWWVNSGTPSVLHRDYGDYLTWVLDRATEGVSIYDGRVTEVTLADGHDHWQVEVAERGRSEDPEHHTGRVLVLTGPGVHRHFPHDPEVESRVFHCDSRREEFERVPESEPVEIAIVGGGESALSALVFLREMRPEAKLIVYTPTLPLSRGESFLENRVFADPDSVEWEHLDEDTRRDFVKHCDRGVFDQSVLARIANDAHCSFVTGRALHVPSPRTGRGRCSSSKAPLKGCDRNATTSSSTAPASTCCASSAASSRTPCATKSKNSAVRSGTAPRRARCRSAAASNWKGCGRGCTSPASAASGRGPVSPISAASACSPTGCSNRFCRN
jgi:mycobactin lysine-N-oxygenase